MDLSTTNHILLQIQHSTSHQQRQPPLLPRGEVSEVFYQIQIECDDKSSHSEILEITRNYYQKLYTQTRHNRDNRKTNTEFKLNRQ